MNGLFASLSVFAVVLGGHQRMYTQNNYLYQSLDPDTGEVFHRALMSPFILNGGLAYDDGRLYFMDQNIGLERDGLMELDIATGESRQVGLTNLSNGFDCRLAVDPQDGELYATFGNDLYHIDKFKGTASLRGKIDLALTVTAFAIDLNGRGVVSSQQAALKRAAIYEVFLVDAQVSEIGVPGIEDGRFSALAFDASGQLWGQHHAWANPFESRTYIINLLDLSVVEQGQVLIEYSNGFAFGPAPRVDGYCVATSSGAGCVPQADWHGHPSASSDGGFSITCCEAQNQSAGMLLIGTGGRASTPFQGGTLCVAPPWSAAAAGSSGGSPASTADCSGAWSLDLNAWLSQHAPQAPSSLVQVQWWGRDNSGEAMSSAALEVALLP